MIPDFAYKLGALLVGGAILWIVGAPDWAVTAFAFLAYLLATIVVELDHLRDELGVVQRQSFHARIEARKALRRAS